MSFGVVQGAASEAEAATVFRLSTFPRLKMERVAVPQVDFDVSPYKGMGRGIRALRDLKKGTFVTHFGGVVRMPEKGEKNPWMLHVLGSSYAIDAKPDALAFRGDAADYAKGVAWAVNSSQKIGTPNARFVLEPSRWQVWIVLTRDVAAGDQILVNYPIT